MNKRQVASMIRKINKHKDAIGKHRDALRDLISEIDAICDDCDEAYHDLVRATDTLSKYL